MGFDSALRLKDLEDLLWSQIEKRLAERQSMRDMKRRALKPVRIYPCERERLSDLALYLQSRGLPAGYPLEPGVDLPWAWVTIAAKDGEACVIGMVVSPDRPAATWGEIPTLAVRWDRATPEQRAAALKLRKVER